MLSSLQRLRVDVDDGVDAGLAHRRRSGGEHLPRQGRERARPVGLGDELGAVASAQPQQRRRAEQRRRRRAAGSARAAVAPARLRRSRTRRSRSGGRRAGSPARAGGASSSARKPATSCRAAYRSGVASGWNVCTITFPGASRPLRPASCVTSWKVRSSARKSGSVSPVSASTTAASETPGKWWPLATICVPISTARSAAAKRSSASRSAPGLPAVSASSRIRSSSGTRLASSASSRCVPAPIRASSEEPQEGHASGTASE